MHLVHNRKKIFTIHPSLSSGERLVNHLKHYFFQRLKKTITLCWCSRLINHTNITQEITTNLSVYHLSLLFILSSFVIVHYYCFIYLSYHFILAALNSVLFCWHKLLKDSQLTNNNFLNWNRRGKDIKDIKKNNYHFWRFVNLTDKRIIKSLQFYSFNLRNFSCKQLEKTMRW